MSETVFNNKDIQPTNSLLAKNLGVNFKYWTGIQDYITANYENTHEEWKFYGKKYGWQLKTFLKKRNLFFLIPSVSNFKIVFIFGDRVVEEIKNSKISRDLIDIVINARKYAEGRGLSFDVNDNIHLSNVKTLIAIKIKN